MAINRTQIDYARKQIRRANNGFDMDLESRFNCLAGATEILFNELVEYLESEADRPQRVPAPDVDFDPTKDGVI